MIRFWQSGNKAAKYLLVGLLTVICVSMVAYLIPGFMSGDSATGRTGVVASVGGQEIRTEDVQKYVNMMVQQQRMQGRSVPDFYIPILNQQAIQTLLGQAELRYESERLGLRVSDQEVRDELRTGQYAEAFFPGGNWIGQEKYEELMRDSNTTPDEFERQTRLELLKNKLLATVTAGVTVAPAEVERAYRDQNLKIKFDYAIINADEVKKQISPTEAELKAYYDAHKKEYENYIKEKRQVHYFLISDKQAEAKVTITPDEIEQYYRKNQDQYRTQDRVKVRHILISAPKPGPDGKVDQKAMDAARAKAADVVKQLKAGGDFAELAKKYSEDSGSKDQGGELGWQGHDSSFVNEFKQAMFALNKGQISDPVQSIYGFHIIQAVDKETAGLKPLADVKGDIEKNLKEQKKNDILDKMGNTAEADARSPGGFNKAAARQGATVIPTGPIERKDKLAGVGDDPQLMNQMMNQIFTVKENAGVQSFRAPHDYVLFEVTKIIPPRTPDFAEIKDKVANDFKGERVNALVSQKTTELADRAHAEHDLRKAAKEAGATVKTSDLVARSASVPDIGPMSGNSPGKAFDLKVGEISGSLAAGANGVVVAILERQEPPLTGDDFAKASDGLRERLIQSKRQEALQLFIENLDMRLKKEGKVKVNESEAGRTSRKRS